MILRRSQLHTHRRCELMLAAIMIASQTSCAAVQLLKQTSSCAADATAVADDSSAHMRPPCAAAPAMPTAKTWRVLKHAALAAGALPGVPHASNGGMMVPFEVRVTKSHGRGIFASADVPEGSMVWRGTPANVATFPTDVTWAAFYDALPKHLQCDALHWHWFPTDGFRSLALDEGSLINHGAGLVSNIGCEGNPGDDCDNNSYALRTIKQGEEFLEDYSTY